MPSPTTQANHPMPFGATVLPDGSVHFRVWAPEATSLQLELSSTRNPLDMIPDGQGWHSLITSLAHAGATYRYILPDGLCVPDPVSRFQPFDVDGPSQVMDPAAYTWRTLAWQGRPWHEAVIYELHVGTFTPEGTFQAAIAKLDHLVSLGITAIEIISVGDFPGDRNWGYDGVLLYAPDSTYGTPDDLKALVDAAHERSLMVILDVVYNHFGPEGNFIPRYFPDISTDRYTTPWGQALNFDARHSEQTREFILHNALYWIEEFRMDGLRLDAVHAIMDSSSIHILDELAARVRHVAGTRYMHLILESDDPMGHLLGRDAMAQPLSSTAQWNHEIQQLAHLGLTPDRPEDPTSSDPADTARLARALTEGFTSHLPGRAFAQNTLLARKLQQPIPALGFIAFLQSHDVVGNRIRGERITDLAPAHIVRALASIYLLLPQVPMLFMGEEWAASTPFPYFCDFSGDLAQAVRNGRLAQFGPPEADRTPAFLATVPDPIAEETFLSAKLHWNELPTPPHAVWLTWYTRILATRHRSIIPLLPYLSPTPATFHIPAPRALDVRWQLPQSTLRLCANLSDRPSPGFGPSQGEILWHESQSPADAPHLGPWSTRWSLESKQEPTQ